MGQSPVRVATHWHPGAYDSPVVTNPPLRFMKADPGRRDSELFRFRLPHRRSLSRSAKFSDERHTAALLLMVHPLSWGARRACSLRFRRRRQSDCFSAPHLHHTPTPGYYFPATLCINNGGDATTRTTYADNDGIVRRRSLPGSICFDARFVDSILHDVPL